MRTKTLLLFILFYYTFSFCQSTKDGIWKSKFSDAQLMYDSNWKLTTPYLDAENKILVGITDVNNHSSFMVRITPDVTKEQLSDKDYNNATIKQMLKANPETKLLVNDKIYFKGIKYNRMMFSLKGKFGDFISTSYIFRDGKKLKGIQFNYPASLVKDPLKQIPKKIEKVLFDLKI